MVAARCTVAGSGCGGSIGFTGAATGAEAGAAAEAGCVMLAEEGPGPPRGGEKIADCYEHLGSVKSPDRLPAKLTLGKEPEMESLLMIPWPFATLSARMLDPELVSVGDIGDAPNPVSIEDIPLGRPLG